MTEKLELTTTEVNYLIHLLDLRGNALMKRTSKQSEHELGRIDALTDKILLQCLTEEVQA
jgi:hypothetical protein